MEILRIEPTNEHFAQAGDLRERVLLRAVGFTLAQFDEVYGSADRFYHFIALGDADDGEWAERVMGVSQSEGLPICGLVHGPSRLQREFV